MPGRESDAQPISSPASFPFKFRAYVYDSLLEDEQMVAAVYEPALRARASRWAPFLSPNRAIAITDRALIVIEDRRNRYRFGDPSEADYTVSRHFYPLDCLRAATLESAPEADTLKLDFARANAHHEVVLPLSAVNAQILHAALRDRVQAQAAGV